MAIFPETLVDSVRDALGPEVILRRINYRPEMIQDAGDLIKCFCPLHRETVFRTLIVDKAAARYRCSNYNCPGHAGGDMLDLYARARGLGYEQALLELAASAGIIIEPGLIEDYIAHSLEVARNYTEMGVLVEAEEHYNQILRLKPESLPALEGLLQVHERSGRRPSFTAARLALAQAYARAGRAESAIGLLRGQLAENPADIDARLLLIEALRLGGREEELANESVALADELAATGQIDRAIQVFRSVGGPGALLDTGPRVIELLAAAGRKEEAVAECLARADQLAAGIDPEGAVETLRLAIELDPAREELVVRQAGIVAEHKLVGAPMEESRQRIESLLAARSHGPAAQALDLLEAAFPGRPSLLALRADLEDGRGNAERALELRLGCVDALQGCKEFEAALAVLEKIMAGRRDNVALLSRKANLLRELGDIRRAIPVYLAIVELFRGAEEFEHAAAVYQTIIDLEPERIQHQEAQLELYLELGLEPLVAQKTLALADAWCARNKPGRATAALGRALELAPASPELIERHGALLEAEGRRGEAAEQFMALGRLLLERGEHEVARPALERALRCVPEHLEARELLADALAAQGSSLQAMGIYLDLAEFFLRDGAPQAVVRLAQKALAFQPEHMPALLLLARAWGDAGELDKQRSVQLRLARIYLNGQSFTRATEVLEEILARQEDCGAALEQLVAIAETQRQPTQSVAYLWRLAQVHARAGRREEEQAALDQVLARDGRHLPAWSRRLELLAQWAPPRALEQATQTFVERMCDAGAIEDAIQLLEDLCQGPTTPKPELMAGLARLHELAGNGEDQRSSLRLRAELLGKLLRDQEALAAWDQLAKLAPDDLSILRTRIEIMMRNSMLPEVRAEYHRLARVLIGLGRLEEAQVALIEVISLGDGATDARDDLIEIYVRTGQVDRAIELLEDAAATLIEEARLKEAIATYERIIQIAPEQTETYRRVIAIRQRTGDLTGALEVYERLLDAAESSPESGLFEQAAQEAILLAPDHAPLRRRLADHHLAQGRRTEAESVLLALALRLLERDSLDEARSALERLLEINPDSLPARAHRAELLARGGQAEDALNEFRLIAGALSSNPAALALSDPARPFRAGNYEGNRLVEDYTFDSFVVGGRNNFAHATAMAIARAPARNYNPLFLYSDVGLGKTHLCHAIAHDLVERHPQLKVLYTSAEDFVDGLIEAIQANSMPSFRNRYRLTDVLLIDDVQVLSGKERAQEEFFLIFNAAFQAGKQIVLTSDRPPREIGHLEKRLKSRFGAGIIVDIQSPDLETRVAILRHEMRSRGKADAVGEDVLFYLAEQVETNVRELKGALNQVLARQDFSGESIDIPSAREILARNLAGT